LAAGFIRRLLQQLLFGWPAQPGASCLRLRPCRKAWPVLKQPSASHRMATSQGLESDSATRLSPDALHSVFSRYRRGLQTDEE